MGNCLSNQEESTPLSSAAASGSNNTNSNNPKSPAKTQDEQKIELAFKAKRANVFNQGVDTEKKHVAKVVAKNATQVSTIRKALLENFIFATLSEEELKSLVDAMEIVNVAAGENVITQGAEGDYYYVVEKGTFSVLVNKVVVGQISEGKSFGELALLYNQPRAATIRADTAAVVYTLDRSTFRYTLAHSSANRNAETQAALSKVSLLSTLTPAQIAKVSEAVELVTYNPGDAIIKKGSEGNIFYMIKDGVVKVSDVGAGGQFADHKLRAGDYFGERALVTGEPRAANVVAESKVVVMALDRTAFNSLLGPLKDVIDHNMNMRVLESIKLFANLSAAEKAKVVRSFTSESHPIGTTIVREGDKGSKFYIIKDGTAKVVANGNTVVELIGGTYFGEMALLDDDVRKASVITTSAVDVFVLDRSAFNNVLGSLKDIMARDMIERKKTMEAGGSAGSTKCDIKFSDLKTLAVLGSGTFGKVTLVQHNGQVYALKAMLKSEIVAHKQQANVINEKNVMVQCNHTFVLKLHTTYKDPKKLYMLLEFVQGGELFSVLHTATTDGVPDNQAKFYGGGVLLALEHLHSKDIAYRDMKPENCLIDKFGYPKMVDFGFAKVIKGKSFTLCGTPEYLAPEIVLGRGHNKAVDYWAFGILLHEMSAGYSPFSDPQGMDQVVICKNIVNGRLVFPKNFHPDLKDLVKKLLSREVQSRLGNLRGGCEDIKDHKWFSSLSFDALVKRELKAPWVPKLKSDTDTSNFDPYGEDDHVDTGYIDKGDWDKDF